MVLLLLLSLLLLVTNFMRGIYDYIPETNHVLGYIVLQLLYSYSSRQFIVIIIIIRYHFYAALLQICIQNKPCF
jgi:hypothetical protein